MKGSFANYIDYLTKKESQYPKTKHKKGERKTNAFSLTFVISDTES